MRKTVCVVICLVIAFTCLNIGTTDESDLQAEKISCKGLEKRINEKKKQTCSK